jgi:hypothetical protein
MFTLVQIRVQTGLENEMILISVLFRSVPTSQNFCSVSLPFRNGTSNSVPFRRSGSFRSAPDAEVLAHCMVICLIVTSDQVLMRMFFRTGQQVVLCQ